MKLEGLEGQCAELPDEVLLLVSGNEFCSILEPGGQSRRLAKEIDLGSGLQPVPAQKLISTRRFAGSDSPSETDDRPSCAMGVTAIARAGTPSFTSWFFTTSA